MTEDYRGKIREGLGTIEKIALSVPLFRGYKEKEIRRESDRLLRTFIHLRLEGAKENIKSVRKYSLDNGSMRLYDDCDTLITTVDTISQKVYHAEHGYAGFWDPVKVKEEDLDRIYSFDLGLVERTLKIEELSKSLADRLAAESLETSGRCKTGYDYIGHQIGELLREVNLYNIEFSRRREILSKIR